MAFGSSHLQFVGSTNSAPLYLWAGPAVCSDRALEFMLAEVGRAHDAGTLVWRLIEEE